MDSEWETIGIANVPCIKNMAEQVILHDQRRLMTLVQRLSHRCRRRRCFRLLLPIYCIPIVSFGFVMHRLGHAYTWLLGTSLPVCRCASIVWQCIFFVCVYVNDSDDTHSSCYRIMCENNSIEHDFANCRNWHCPIHQKFP